MAEALGAFNRSHDAKIYTQAGPATPGAPRELGMLARIDGVRGGVGEIRHRLEVFRGRLNGADTPMPMATETSPLGLGSTVSATEEEIRACINLLVELSEAF